MTWQVCGDSILDMMMLSVVGNFVASPTSLNNEATVPSVVRKPFTATAAQAPQNLKMCSFKQVMDAYTGQLVVHMPYDAVRGYFVEALLVISIIVITRISFVRNVTYNLK
jgi:hypothetical protein